MSVNEATPLAAEAAAATEDDEVEIVDMKFTKQLRKATKDVHNLSDILINTKFAIALTDDAVWYDGLLAFYEIYKFFETHLPEHLLPKELHRTEAFERDFAYFYGADWKKTYKPRPAVESYLAHLEKVAEKSEILLFAFAFQMYMALMSGGQLLQKKRMIERKLWIFSTAGDKEKQQEADTDAAVTDLQNEKVNVKDGELDSLLNRPMPAQVTLYPAGCEATYFPTRIPVIKSKLRRIFNNVYGKLNDDMRTEFIEESRNVFRLNMEVVRTIKGVNRANLKIGLAILLITGIVLAIKFAIK